MNNPPLNLHSLGTLKHYQVRRAQSSMNEVRTQNQQAVIEAILHAGQTSRKDLCRTTGLSASTVGLIVNQLIEKGILMESGAGSSDRGRKPIAIGINAGAGTVLAVDVNDMSIGLFDLHLKPIDINSAYQPEKRPSPQDVVQLIKTEVETMTKTAPPPLVIGVSVPGEVDPTSGIVLNSTNLEWTDVSLGMMIARETGIPTVVESNMVCLSLTEAWNGVAGGVDDFAFIHVGWRGVGAGLVLNGDVYRGANLRAAEIGHLQVEPDGPLCRCGKRGCLEAIASGRNTTRRAFTGSAGAADGSEGEVDLTMWKKLLLAAERGEEKALAALNRTASALGRAAASLAVAVDPSMLVFGGRVMEAQKYIMPQVEQVVKEMCLPATAAHIQIKVATDAAEKSMTGAARIALRSYLFNIA
ncbi:MAG TPA: ROK family transcriptional regulator [Firmicutes bacterium]|nr:ROK family transcriptional regulator [Bacillota bacterium]